MKKIYEEPILEFIRLTFDDMLNEQIDLSTPETFPDGDDDGDEF